MDDVGLHLAEQRHTAVERRIGRFLLRSMPVLLTLLSAVGTIAMLWVGGGIILHGMHELGWSFAYDAVHGVEHVVAQAAGPLGSVLGWITYAALSAVAGLMLGAIIGLALHKGFKFGAH